MSAASISAEGSAVALLMAWMPPPDGIAMCQCDECRSLTEGRRIHAIKRAGGPGLQRLDQFPRRVLV